MARLAGGFLPGCAPDASWLLSSTLIKLPVFCCVCWLSPQVHVLLTGGTISMWQVTPAFVQQLQQCPPSLACVALQQLHERGSIVQQRDATSALQRLLHDLAAAGFSEATPAGVESAAAPDVEGQLFKVGADRLCFELQPFNK